MRYTLIIPAYNEEKIIYNNIEILYKKIQQIRHKLRTNIELIILDDGSKDSTFIEAQRLIKKYPQIKYAWMKGPSRRENLISYISTEVETRYVGYMDCDLATNLDDLENLIMISNKYDIVSGSRYLTSSKMYRSIDRAIISVLFNFFVRLLFRSKIRDHECGFKIFDTKKLKEIIKLTGIGNKDRRMFWDSEMWVYAQSLGYKVLEIPIKWNAGKQSALRFTSELSMIKYIIKFWARRKWTRKNLKY